MMNPNRREHLRRTLRLVGFHPHFVSGDFLVIFLAQNGDHVKRSASRKSGCNQFNGFGPGASGSVVQQEIVLTASSRHELSLLA